MGPAEEGLFKKIAHAFHVIFEFLRNILKALASPLTGASTSTAAVGVATLVGCAVIFSGGVDVLNQSPHDTHILFKNSGQSWVHIASTLTNTNSNNNIYLDMWIKPGDNVALDLSKALGSSDQQVPAGTQFTFSAYKNVLSPSPGGTDALNLNVEGWSGNGQHNAQLFNSQFPGIPLQQLPNGVTDSKITISSSPSDGQNYYSSISAGSGSVFEQESFIINDDGTVSITSLTSPVFCSIVTL